MKMRQIIPILVAAIMVAPVATATWRAFGTYEPDHPLDVTGGLMFRYPDTNTTTNRIYFNVFQTVFGTSQNLNTGATGSRFLVPGLQMYGAVFGAWKDCNGDGYVGLAESAMVVYPSTLLTNTSVCPPGMTVHNDGQWVWEWIIVGYNPTAPEPQSRHPRQIVDKEALVWGDFGLPGISQGGGCPLTPFPHGTTSGTGHTIRYFDCILGQRIQTSSDTITGPIDENGDLAWDDKENPQQSDSLLNQHYPVNLFGNPTNQQTGILELDSNENNPRGSDTPQDRDYAFTTWDRDDQGTCNGRSVEVRDPVGAPTIAQPGVFEVGPNRVVVNDPTFNPATGNGLIFGNYGKTDENFTDEDGRYASVANPNPNFQMPTVDSSTEDGDGIQVHTGSYADGLNETMTGIRVGGGDDFYDNNVGGDCNMHDDGKATNGGESTYNGVHQTAFFRADAPFEPTSAIKKAQDIAFTYFQGSEVEGETADVFGPNAPNSIVATNTMWWQFEPQWNSRSIWVTTPQSVNRNTGEPDTMRNLTFYGRVGQATFDKNYVTPMGGADKFKEYGSEACVSGIGNSTGISHENGWWCIPERWYTDAEHNPIRDAGQVWAARAGFKYQVRDIDCLDGTLHQDVGVRASLVDLKGGSCASAGAAFPADDDAIANQIS